MRRYGTGRRIWGAGDEIQGAGRKVSVLNPFTSGHVNERFSFRLVPPQFNRPVLYIDLTPFQSGNFGISGAHIEIHEDQIMDSYRQLPVPDACGRRVSKYSDNRSYCSGVRYSVENFDILIFGDSGRGILLFVRLHAPLKISTWARMPDSFLSAERRT